LKNFNIRFSSKFLYILILFKILFYSFPSFSEIIIKEEPKKNNIFLHNKQNINESEKNNLFLLFYYFQDFIANLSENLNVMDIESDIQYKREGELSAEGNVKITFKGKQLKADKLKYDEKNKKLTLIGNVIFKKGSQYFEATNIYYDLKNEIGSIDNVYGLIRPKTFDDDIGIEINSKNNNTFDRNISNLEAFNNDSFELVNESNSSDPIKSFKLSFPEINKWRFKSKKIIIEPNLLKSKEIFFTNDAYNQPQFLLESYDFRGSIDGEKINFISKNTWLNFDNKFKFPIGRSSFIDGQDNISRWGIGYDKEEKDGFFIQRGFNKKEIFGKYVLKINSYFLLERGLKGETNSFYRDGKSISKNKITYQNNLADLFALDTKLTGKLHNWDLELSSSNNSLDPNKIKSSSRIKLNIKKSIDLNDKDRNLNIKFSSSYREKINKGFSGEEEIYWGNALNIENKNFKQFDNYNIYYSFIYELGKFNAKSSINEELIDLFRNLFIGEFSQDIPIWRKKGLRSSIDETYKYSPRVIAEGLIWKNSIKSALFLYSNNKSQKAILFSSGPEVILGGLKNNILDYTKLSTQAEYIIKQGDSPFAFDNVNDSFRIRFNLAQQLFGPVILNTGSYLNLNYEDKDYGKFVESIFGIDIKRRAYDFGLFYKPASETYGIKFNILNFNYLGIPPSF